MLIIETKRYKFKHVTCSKKILRFNNYIVQVLHIMEDYRNEVNCFLCKHNLSTLQVTKY